jgi:hypothetical protein
MFSIQKYSVHLDNSDIASSFASEIKRASNLAGALLFGLSSWLTSGLLPFLGKR